jgi:hypothetical protein
VRCPGRFSKPENKLGYEGIFNNEGTVLKRPLVGKENGAFLRNSTLFPMYFSDKD